MDKLSQAISEIGIVPVIKLSDPERGIKKGTDLSRVRTLLIYSVQIPSTSLR